MHASSSKPPKDLVKPAVQANKDHQYALKVYTERLETELKTLDKLLAAAEVSADEEEEVSIVNSGGTVFIPGAARPWGPISTNELTDESSLFYADAARRHRYETFTVSHPMKAPELGALADAVRSENYRLHALEAQARGVPGPFLAMSEPPPDFNMNKDGIDWERVAQKVSSASSIVQRSAKECEIRWLGERHPQFSDAQWTQSEIAKVKDLVDGAREGEVDWVEIAEKLGTGRTPVDCMRHAIARRAHTWTADADRRLLEAVDVYGTDSWALVARVVSEDATAAQCQSRYVRTLDPTLKRGPWTPDEDEQLRRAAAVFGNAWVDVATYVDGRNNEQCRDRYQEYVNPSVTKGKWTDDQDSALLKAVEQVGEGKWKEVSRVLNMGRTDNMCRMRYTVLVKRKKTGTESPGPSKTTSVSSSRRPTPAEKDTPEMLILHHESLYPQSSTSTPALTPASAPAPQPKPKPKPRARRKQPAATAEVANPGASDTSAAGPSTSIQLELRAAETSQGPEDPETSEVSSKRPATGGEAEDAQSNKRRRTMQPSPVPATRPAVTEETTEEDAVMEDFLPTAESALREEAPERDARSTPTIRGRGRGRARARGTRRGRGRPPGRKSNIGPAPEEGVADDTAADISPAQPESGPSVGGRSTAPAPTRRQPPRAANKASRSQMQRDIDVDS